MIQSVETFATITTNQLPALGLSADGQLFGEKLLKIYSTYLKNENPILGNKTSGQNLQKCVDVDLDGILSSSAPTLTNNDIETSTYKIEIIPHLIMVEMPLIFKFSENVLDTKKILGTLSQFSNISCAINDCTKSHKEEKMSKIGKRQNYNFIEMNISKYNKLLNFIQAHIRTDEDEFLTDEIRERRKLILDIRYYNAPFMRTEKSSIILKKQVHEDSTIAKTRLNYDGSEIDYSSQNILRTSKSVDSAGKADCGLIFGCETKKEIFDILKVAIENASLEHLVCEYDSVSSKTYGGYIQKCTHKTIFYLNLHLRHGGCKDKSAKYMDGILPSHSTKIVHVLKNKPMLVSSIQKIYHNFDIGIFASIGIYYIKYHQLVLKKIYKLIELGFNKNDLKYRVLECYRPECCYKDIVLKYDSKIMQKDITCAKCTIAELCLLCGSNSHFGECTKIDESSQQWIEENTKKCPNCQADVQKNNGCQHITCVCRTHFCWSCLAMYHPNDITEHYRGGDVYHGTCAVNNL
jgi:macrodomain Ter protein organizer (MatP/YcbG family)